MSGISFVRHGDFYDLTVPGAEHYLAQGLWHHNSGKTLAACILGVQLSIIVPGNRGIICRRTYSKLHDSTEQIFLEVLQRYGIPFRAREMRDGWPHRVIMDNGSEVVFRETKDLGRWLGPEFGWFYVDEASEEPEKTFKGLQGRLRLPRAADYLRGILTTNPPNELHWIHKTFGDEPGVRDVVTEGRVTRYHLIRSRTIDNPNLPKEYVDDLRANNSESEIKRILEGEYGFTQDGDAVYPQFQHKDHVQALRFKSATSVRGWDFGFRHPAVTWHQFMKCPQNTVHWNILACHAPQNIEAEPLATEVLKLHKNFTDGVDGSLFRMPVIDIGDTAGAQISDKGPGPIIRLAKSPWRLHFKHKKFPDITPGLDLIRKCLRTKCKCGKPVLMVNQGNKPVIDMFSGGYHYPKDRGGAPVDKPFKDGYFDDIADSIRYVGELAYRQFTRDPRMFEEMMADQPRGMVDPLNAEDLNAWMGEP